MKYNGADDTIMYFDFDECRHSAVHSHQNPEIIYLLEGSMELTVGRSIFQIQKDDIILIEANREHSYKAKESVLTGILHIDSMRLQNYIDTKSQYIQCNSVIDKNSGYQEMRKLLNQIFRLYFDKKQEAAYLNSLYFALLHILLTHFTYSKEQLLKKHPDLAEEERINEVIGYIRSHYQGHLSLNELAEQLYLTPAYLSKYIKRHLGRNFVEYVNEVRLDNAVEAMRLENSQSLTRTAMDNGFPSAQAFAAAFKKVYGMNPSVWQKEYQAERKKQRDTIEKQETARKEHIRAYLEQDRGGADKKEEDAAHLFCTDVNAAGNYRRCLNSIINIGSITKLLRSDLQEHLLMLKEELKIKYVRFWDVFTDEMLFEVSEGKVNQNYARVDKAFDFLVNGGMHPFIEFGFKPVTLMRSVDKTVVEEERKIWFETNEQYGKAVHRLLAHCVNRYGLEEVSAWYFEQWGDPRITEGENYGDYFLLFETLYQVVKGISPYANVGGAGFGRLYSTLEFRGIMELWSKRPCHPDFISLYCYPYMARGNVNAENNDRIQDPGFIRNQAMMMRQVMKEVSMQNIRLIATEWSSSISSWNSLNDSVYKGAFILKSIIDNSDCLDMMGYWLASDIHVEHYDTGRLLHGGNGLLSADGIRKPAFYAMQFANRMQRYLLGRDDNSMVTADGFGNYYIVCHNYANPNFKYYLKREDEVDVRKQFLLFDEAESLHLHFQIKNVKAGQYLIKVRALNKEYGSAQDKWGEMGFHEELNQQDIHYLREISCPRISIEEQYVEDHVLAIDTVLKPHEIQAIHIVAKISE